MLKSRKPLKTAARIDKTNTTTLRFLKEIEEQTGRATNLESRFRMKEKEVQREVWCISQEMIPLSSHRNTGKNPLQMRW